MIIAVREMKRPSEKGRVKYIFIMLIPFLFLIARAQHHWIPSTAGHRHVLVTAIHSLCHFLLNLTRTMTEVSPVI